MADNAVIGALRVVLGLDSATFEQGLKSTGDKLSAFEKSFAKVSTGVVAAGNVIAAGVEKLASSIISSMSAAIDRVADIGRTAHKAGVDVQEFSVIAAVANKVKVSTDELGTSFYNLNRSIAEVAAGKSGDAQKAFEVLGIRVRDTSGNVKDGITVFEELTNKFKNYTEGANTAALAQAIFKRSGREMVDLLSQGSDAIEKQRAEMEALGTIITADTAAAAIKAQLEFKKLNSLWDSMVLQLTVAMLPSLQELSGTLVQLSKDSKGSEAAQQAFQLVIKAGTTAIETLLVAVQAVSIKIVAFFQAANAAAHGEFAQALDILVQGYTDIVQLAEGFARLKLTVNKGAQDLFDYAQMLKVVDENMQALAGVKMQPPSLPLGDLGKTLDQITVKTAELNGEFNNLAPGLAAQAASLGLIDQAAVKLTNDQTTLNSSLQSLNIAMLMLDAAQQKVALQTPWEQYQQQVKLVNIELANHILTVEQAADRSAKAAEKLGVSWKNAAQDITTNLAAGFEAAAQANKSFATAAKVAAIASAIVNTYLAATKAYANFGGWPLGAAAAAATVVAGLGMVAKIQAQQFAKGGSFRVGGGMTGVDSQMLTINAAPGEMVDIKRPQQLGGTSPTGGTEVTLKGLRGRDLFTGQMVVDLITALNDAHSDGYKLKVA